jgi:hypothetical protein
MMRGSPGHASSKSAGDPAAACRNANATTTTPSRGPMTGRNSGIRSIGDSTRGEAARTGYEWPDWASTWRGQIVAVRHIG